jgi:hypothetical protein
MRLHKKLIHRSLARTTFRDNDYKPWSVVMALENRRILLMSEGSSNEGSSLSEQTDDI